MLGGVNLFSSSAHFAGPRASEALKMTLRGGPPEVLAAQRPMYWLDLDIREISNSGLRNMHDV